MDILYENSKSGKYSRVLKFHIHEYFAQSTRNFFCFCFEGIKITPTITKDNNPRYSDTLTLIHGGKVTTSVEGLNTQQPQFQRDAKSERATNSITVK